MREVVRELRAQGHRVEYYVRKDGGILIKRIDNQTYKAATGNIQARQMLGLQISEKRAAQLHQNVLQLKNIRKAEEDIKEEWRRVREKWRKAFPRTKGKPHPAGAFTWKRIRRSLRLFGREEAMRRIGEAERYASGLAYSKNVEQLVFYINQAGVDYNSPELQKLAVDVAENAYLIKENAINPAYFELYKLNKGKSPKSVARETRAILGLANL